VLILIGQISSLPRDHLEVGFELESCSSLKMVVVVF
jgi:hypothetical protein